MPYRAYQNNEPHGYYSAGLNLNATTLTHGQCAKIVNSWVDQKTFESIQLFLEQWRITEEGYKFRATHPDGAYIEWENGILGWHPRPSSHRMRSGRTKCEDRYEFSYKAYSALVFWGIIEPREG